MTIADLIRAKREERGLSQRALAKLLCVSPSAVAQWETGDKVPTHRHMTALKQALGFQAGVIVVEGSPYTGQLVEDPDELALIGFWQSLSDAKREVLTDFLHISHPVVRKAV